MNKEDKNQRLIKALDTLQEIADDKDASYKMRVKAAVMVVDATEDDNDKKFGL